MSSDVHCFNGGNDVEEGVRDDGDEVVPGDSILIQISPNHGKDLGAFLTKDVWNTSDGNRIGYSV